MIRVFVGTAANEEDAESQAVLEYSLKKHASQPVEIVWMQLNRDPKSFWFSTPKVAGSWTTSKWATPFSGFRWGIPAFCKFSGRAIYCDSDVIYMDDVAKLWGQKIPAGKVIVAKEKSTRQCVMLWDCAAAKPHLPPIAEFKADPKGHRKMAAYFKEHPELVEPFKGNWNCLDGEDYVDLRDPRIKVIHYSSMAHQPHLKYAVPRLAELGRTHWFDGEIKTHWRQDMIDLFEQMYAEAQAAGYTVDRYRLEAPYGPYKKQSQVNYRPHKYGAGKSA